MFLWKEATGMDINDVRDMQDIEHEELIDFTRDGDAISLASQRLDTFEVYYSSPWTRSEPPIYFIVWNVDTGIVSQLWLFPNDYKGLFPTQFME